MRNLIYVLLAICCLGGVAVVAQEEPALMPFEMQIGTQADGFGGELSVAGGILYNYGDAAYRDIQIYVEAYDADEEVIGEGFGYLVDACGSALLDYALPAGQAQAYSAPFEVFAEGEVERVVLSIEAEAVMLAPAVELEVPGVRRIASDEVVMMEWRDEETLLYGVGCAGEVFTELEWWSYQLEDERSEEIEHPDAAQVTAEMIARSDAALITQSGEQDPALYFGSQLTFPPGARRIVYQNDLHTIFSAEPDGSFKRLIHDGLHQHSLRGFLWGRNPGVFLAYYFGSYGEPVYYFSADVAGKMLMGRLETLAPSLIVPGPAPDGLAAVVGRHSDAGSGYFWQNAFGGSELLFEADLPGNNYPAPIVTRDFIYIIGLVDGMATLQCFQRRTRELHTISALPLRLTREARAWAALSPDGSRLALGANGREGGLWWLDVGDQCN